MTPSRFSRITIALVAVLLAGCGASSPSTTPELGSPASASPATAATQSPTPEPTATTTPSPTAAPTPSPTPTATPTPALPLVPDGQTGRIRLPDEALALTLPRGWQTIGLTADDVDAIFNALPEGTLPAGLKDQVPALVASGLKLWGFDLRPTGLGANCNVIAQPFTVPPSLLRVTAKASLSMVSGVSNVRYTDLRISGRKALRIDYVYVLPTTGQSMKTRGTQVYIARPDNLVVITVSIPAGGRMSDRDSIVNSIRLLD